MKVRDTLIGCIIETNDPFVIEQFKKNSARYNEIKKEVKKTEKTKSNK